MKFLRGTIFDPLNLTEDRKRDKEHKAIFRNKLAEINNLITGVKSKKLSELIEASKEVKGYGPVRAESYGIFKSRINFTSQKRFSILSNIFRFKTRSNIQAKKHKAQKENRAE
jgi:hypothetical protein